MWNDFSAILWREYREYTGDLWNKTGIFLVVAALGGLVFPNLFLSEPSLIPYSSRLLDMIAFYICYMYAGMVSDKSFSGERAQGTMHVVLASPLRPQCYFLGKWAWFMTQAALLLLLMTTFSHMSLLYRYSNPWPNAGDLCFTGFGMLFVLCACSYFIAANSAISLILRSTQSAQLFTAVAAIGPLFVGLAANRFFGVGLDYAGLAVIGGLCVALGVASFALAMLAFRLEYVRL